MRDLIEEDINDYNNDDYISKNVIVINNNFNNNLNVNDDILSNNPLTQIYKDPINEDDSRLNSFFFSCFLSLSSETIFFFLLFISFSSFYHFLRGGLILLIGDMIILFSFCLFFFLFSFFILF